MKLKPMIFGLGALISFCSVADCQSVESLRSEANLTQTGRAFTKCADDATAKSAELYRQGEIKSEDDAQIYVGAACINEGMALGKVAGPNLVQSLWAMYEKSLDKAIGY